jgi:hypothetical protein
VFDTLRVLVGAGRLVKKEDLLRTVWTVAAVEENNLNHNISLLWKALGEKATGMPISRPSRGLDIDLLPPLCYQNRGGAGAGAWNSSSSGRVSPTADRVL